MYWHASIKNIHNIYSILQNKWHAFYSSTRLSFGQLNMTTRQLDENFTVEMVEGELLYIFVDILGYNYIVVNVIDKFTHLAMV